MRQLDGITEPMDTSEQALGDGEGQENHVVTESRTQLSK